MNTNRQIAWQKFESTIGDQLNSPIVRLVTDYHNEEVERILGECDIPGMDEMDDEDKIVTSKPVVSVPGDISNEIYLSSAYDCWIGHVNFNIDEVIDEELSEVPGVEAQKTYTRYRFFIGVGRLFDTETVKRSVEKCLDIPDGRTGLLF